MRGLRAYLLEVVQKVLVGSLAGAGWKAVLNFEVAVGEVMALAGVYKIEVEGVTGRAGAAV